MRARAKQEVEKQGQPDALVLYRSLVWEGVLPDGFDREFQDFCSAVSPAAERQRQNSHHFDNVAAAAATMAQVRAPSKNFVSTLEMSAEEKATAPPLEPAFESLLRSGNIHEDVIWACRVQDILDREVFVALHHTVERFMQATRFGDQHGDNIHETRLPTQSYFESFAEALADGSLEAERLDQVVNVVEERAELAKTRNAAKHLGIHLDASLTIQTRRRFTSVPPATTEALHLKFSVLSNLRLLAKMRQPPRQIFADFYRDDISEDLGRAALGEKLSPRPQHRRHQDDRTQVGTLLGVRVPGETSGDQALCSQRFLLPVSLVVRVPRRGAQDGALDAAINNR